MIKSIPIKTHNERAHMKALYRYLLLVTLLNIYGCAGDMVKLNAYDGETLKDSEKGILKCAPDIRIISIDKNEKYNIPPQTTTFFTDCEIGLKPGTHTVDVCYEDDESCLRATPGIIDVALRSADVHRGSNCFPHQITVDIEQNRTYRIKPEITIKTQCKPGSVMTTPYGQIVTAATKKEYDAKFFIVDVTDKEKNQNLYDYAKKESNKAKELQSDENWDDAVNHWKLALDYAIQGDLPTDIRLILIKNYSNALAATCQYDLALENLDKAKVIDDKHEWSLDTTTLALARVNLITQNMEAAKTHYATMQSNYNDSLAKNEIETINGIIKTNSSDPSVISERLRKLDSDIEYGKHCVADKK